MAYTYRYINKQVEFDTTYYTLILEDRDSDELEPIIRIEKAFNIDSKLIDEEFLRLEAYREIDRVLYEQSLLTNNIEVTDGSIS